MIELALTSPDSPTFQVSLKLIKLRSVGKFAQKKPNLKFNFGRVLLFYAEHQSMPFSNDLKIFIRCNNQGICCHYTMGRNYLKALITVSGISTPFKAITVMNVATLKAAATLKDLFNKPASESRPPFG
jgi:hypothetical protein